MYRTGATSSQNMERSHVRYPSAPATSSSNRPPVDDLVNLLSYMQIEGHFRRRSIPSDDYHHEPATSGRCIPSAPPLSRLSPPYHLNSHYPHMSLGEQSTGPISSVRFDYIHPIPIVPREYSPYTVPTNPAPTSSVCIEEACASPRVRHQHHPSGDMRNPLQFTTSNLRMSESCQILHVQTYLGMQPQDSIDNKLEVHASRDVLTDGTTLGTTFWNISHYLHRFSDISISLRVEPDSPNPTVARLLDGEEYDTVDAVPKLSQAVDLEYAVNLKKFTWRGDFASLTSVISGLPKDSIAALCITGCKISPNDASVLVRFFPNLDQLEIDEIDILQGDVFKLPPFLQPIMPGRSRISRLKIRSSAPLDNILREIKFIDSKTPLKRIEFESFGALKAHVFPDWKLLRPRFRDPVGR
ncbi:hypothetical protein BDN70DRAFT_343289 [Pholiota conissans]|uniref:Uncharacterized protein n=1 Tax=Pholiota conissans TaxID=109636 RepID=A0A9P5Z7X2_9AGAR|nr:hypothetical protein BDN70DRAFT_343289 [Pholiota conissans]